MWGLTFFLGTYRNRHSMFVSAADIQDIAVLQALVANVDIRRQISSCKVTEMNIAIGIRQSTGNEDSHSRIIND